MNDHRVRSRPNRAEIRNYNEVFMPLRNGAGQLPMFASPTMPAPAPAPAAPASPEDAPAGQAQEVRINADGACIGNPGPGGFAALIEKDDAGAIVVTGGDPATTNNRMELAAVIEALKTLNQDESRPPRRITVRSDSQYVINAFNQNWLRNWQNNGWQNAKGQPVANMDLWSRLLSETEGREIVWEWVRGHSGDPANEECDRLANRCAQQAQESRQAWVSAVQPARPLRLRNRPSPENIVQAKQLNSSIKQEVELALELLRNGQAQSSREAMETALRTIAKQDEAIATLERKAG